MADQWKKLRNSIGSINSLVRSTSKPNVSVDSVEIQTIESRSNAWWSAVRIGDQQAVEKLIKSSDGNALLTRGAVGETALHMCFLYNTAQHKSLARYFIEHYPHMIPLTYTGPDYDGENCLHIAIVNKDLEMVKLLLEYQPEQQLEARADGSFFKSGQPCYYGGYPLFFGACTNQKEIVELLVEKGADIDAADSNGNNILHMMVLHALPEMYDFAEALWNKKHGKPTQEEGSICKIPLWKRTNGEGLTPLSLAASNGNKDMFNHQLEKRKQLQWAYGPVACYLYPLDQLDGPQGALSVIVDKEQVEILVLPRVVELLKKKWDRFGKSMFYYKLYTSLFYLSLFTLSTTLRSQDDEPNTWISFLLDLFVVAGAVYKGGRELQELQQGGMEYFSGSGAMFLENVVSIVFCPLVILTLVAKHVGFSNYEQAMAPLCILGWSYMLFFFLGFPLTGPFVVMITKMLQTDVLRFSIMFGVFLVGFSQGFHLILDKKGFSGFLEVAQMCFSIIVGGLEMEDFHSEKYKTLSVVFVMIFVILAGIIMLNLLVAMMGDTFSRISDDADKQWHLEWARIILSIQNEIPDFENTNETYKYWVTIEGNKYIQVMEVDNVAYLNK